MRPLVIQHGTVIDPETATSSVTDIVIQDGLITAVEQDVLAPGRHPALRDIDILKADGHLVLPGFVDTHRHTWQSVLRGTAPDLDLGGYLELVGGTYGPRFSPNDVYVAVLLGALECLNAGITTLFDWSHVLNSPMHAEAAARALLDSGIRAILGYGSPAFGIRDLGRWGGDPRVLRETLLADDTGLVRLGLCPLGPSFSSREETVADYRLARELDARISPHVGHGTPDGRRAVEILADLDLLGPDITYVHGNQLTDASLDLLADSGGGVAVAPAVEARMGHGPDPIERMRARGIPVGLGVDVVTTVPGDMFSLMRAALLTAHPALSVPQVLRMATIEGAAALGMADQVGSLRPGKQADIVLLRTDNPGIAPVLDPVAAVVAAADTATVDTVLVGGQVRKRFGRLVTDVNPVLSEARTVAERITGSGTVEFARLQRQGG